VKGFKLLTLAQ